MQTHLRPHEIGNATADSNALEGHGEQWNPHEDAKRPEEPAQLQQELAAGSH